MEHRFEGNYYSTNPCLHCGCWQDESESVDCKGSGKHEVEMEITCVVCDKEFWFEGTRDAAFAAVCSDCMEKE